MTLYLEAAVAAAICAAAAAIVFAIRPFRFEPRAFSDDTHITAVVSARGDPRGLEQAVRELMRCERDGCLRYRSVIIADCGLSAEGHALAELLASGDGRVVLCAPAELPAMLLEDSGWTTTDSTFK